MALKAFEANIEQRVIYSGNSMGYSIFSIHDSSAYPRYCRWYSRISNMGTKRIIKGVEKLWQIMFILTLS